MIPTRFRQFLTTHSLEQGVPFQHSSLARRSDIMTVHFLKSINQCRLTSTLHNRLKMIVSKTAGPVIHPINAERPATEM
ncbi:MAG TPA: hypothetical protein DCM07_26660 [Planctomycetaceae bacterium]|nr:hypothetical protein [Gimesia sp.]HAH48362.1 hypothetical protein [Planctomycetaceae bacterium]HBL43751.1 hypothetical protein [Planctomycetaceae bacterium]